MAKVKPGHGHAFGWMATNCPACHKSNAVWATQQKGLVKATKLDGDSPVDEIRLNLNIH